VARVYLIQLLNVDSHKDRARVELDRLDQQIAQSQSNVVAGRAAPIHAAPKAAAAPAAAAPAVQQAPAKIVDDRPSAF
jgi:hypothetical protein